jgi:hypothetical protein
VFAAFLKRSLAVLAAEHPSGYRRMVAQLGEREVWLEVDRDSVVLCGTGSIINARPRGTHVAAHARASAPVLAAILTGDVLLEEALEREEIWLSGRLDDLAAFYEALQTYFNVAVRCISFAPLLAEFLGELSQTVRDAEAAQCDQPASGDVAV